MNTYEPDGRRNSNQGFTLIELMVTLLVMVVLTLLLWDIFSRQEKLTIHEQDILEMQDNLRVAEKRLTFLFSHAGFGCIDSFIAGKTLNGNEPGVGAVSVDTVFWDLVNQDSSTANLQPDSVVVSLGYKKIAEVNGDVSNLSEVTFKNNISLNCEFKKYICFSPIAQPSGFRKISTSNNSTMKYKINQSVSVQDGDDVYQVIPVRVEIGGAGNRNLIMKKFSDKYDNSKLKEIVNDIDDLQIQYSLDGINWSDVVAAADRNKVKAIKFFLLARASRPDRDYVNKNQYTYAGKTIGPFNDNYRRLLLQRTVWVRNTK